MSFDLTLLNGDIKIGQDGDFQHIFNEDKLIQDMLKAVFTPTGSHKLHPWYGSPLLSNTLGTAIERNLLNTIINNGVFYALSNIQTLQGMQATSGQYLTPREILKSIDEVAVVQDQVDPRQLIVVIRVTTRSGSTVEESFTINL
jgi:hypothetical protein